MSKTKQKIIVASPIGQDDLSVPRGIIKEFRKILTTDSLTDEQFLECCRIAYNFKKKYPKKKMGIGYRLVGIWVGASQRDETTPLMEEFIQNFSWIEIPDLHIGTPPDELWEQLNEFVTKSQK